MWGAWVWREKAGEEEGGEEIRDPGNMITHTLVANELPGGQVSFAWLICGILKFSN